MSSIIAGILALSMCGTVVSMDIFENDTVEATTEPTTAIDIVNDMGAGWNLGNTFDCCNITWMNPSKPSDIETAWGNVTTTEEMISTISSYGFDSVRIPVTWYQMTDDNGDINDDYLARVKEVVDYCFDNDMYAIVNMHWDDSNATSGGKNWLGTADSDLVSVETKYTTMWKEISTYFADYDYHLVFESNNEPSISTNNLITLNQDFVDTVRSTGGNNDDRLLLISSPEANLDKACSSSFTMPNDSANMLAVSVHYYYPSTFCVADKTSTWGYQTTWGTAEDLTTVVNNFNKLTSTYVDNGIPVILGEYGVLTNDEKDDASLKLFLKTIASQSYNTNGISAFLWDSGNGGDMQYFDRKNLTFFDKEIGEIYTNLTNSEVITTDWVDAEIKTDSKGVVSVDVGKATDVKLTIKGVPNSSGTGAIGYWDNNANDGKGGWVQNTIFIRFDIGEDGTGTISQTDSEYEEVLNHDLIKIPTTASVSEGGIQVMFFYGGYADENGDWNDLTSDQYPTLVSAKVPGVKQDDTTTTTTTTPSDTTTTEPTTTTTPVDDSWNEVSFTEDEKKAGLYIIPISNDTTKLKAQLVEGVANAGGNGAISYWDNNANDGAGAWVQNAIMFQFSCDENGEAYISQMNDDDEVINEGFVVIPDGVDTSEVQLQIYSSGYWDGANEEWVNLTSDKFPKLGKVLTDGKGGTVTDEPTDTTTPEPTETTTDQPVDTTTDEPTDTTTTPEPTETTTDQPVDTTTDEPSDTTTTAEPDDTTTTTEPSGDTLLGDINLDGKVSTADLLALKKHLLGVTELESGTTGYTNADVTKDGKVSTADLLALKKFLLGVIESF